jgi:hypothetical protein
MMEATAEHDAGKEALKQLKAARKEQIAEVTARMKIQRQVVKAIKAQGRGADRPRSGRGHGPGGY